MFDTVQANESHRCRCAGCRPSDDVALVHPELIGGHDSSGIGVARVNETAAGGRPAAKLVPSPYRSGGGAPQSRARPAPLQQARRGWLRRAGGRARIPVKMKLGPKYPSLKPPSAVG